MLEIDTIQRKVRIAQKSIFSEVFIYPGRRPAFFYARKWGRYLLRINADGGAI